MRVWNVGEVDIKQFYNSKVIAIKANSSIDVSDDAGLFLLNKKELRGNGLVELKDGDDKSEAYKKGRKQIYLWAKSKYEDYERHCEEREGIKTNPFRPHKEILDYKAIIDNYEKWVADGEQVKPEHKIIVGEKRIFVCPHCFKEFSDKEEYFKHIPEHSKESDNVNIGIAKNTGQRKG